jgi:phospholipase/lecithinase/hemolysin
MNHAAKPDLRAEPTVPGPRRRAHRPRFRSWRRSVVVLAAALLVAACGGSTEQYDPFVPQRLVAFGDEASALSDGTSAPLGANWSVNGVDGEGNFRCDILSIWIQQLAAIYGFVFPECNRSNVAQPQARTWATAGARVADVEIQIAAQAADIRDGDLATVFVGTNDILGDIYPQYPLVGEVELMKLAAARGKRAGELVNLLVAQGARVILVNVPDLGLTPFALKEGSDRAALISRLTGAFNMGFRDGDDLYPGLGLTIIQDGRYIGLAQFDQRSQVIARDPGAYGFANATGAVCKDTAPLPNCLTNTLVDGGSAATWLWADDRWLAPGGHGQLAGMAIDRATRNPF